MDFEDNRATKSRIRFFKKSLAIMPLEQKRKMISKGHLERSIVQQCEALGNYRSGYYYEPRQESDLNLRL